MYQTVQQHRPRPRTLRGLELTGARRAIEPFRGTEIEIHCLIGDNEGSAFAQEIEEFLISSGWHVPGGIVRVLLAGQVPDGMVIFFRVAEGDEPNPAAMALANALLRLGFQIKAAGAPNRRVPDLLVGARGAD